jgi:guanylate kinase
MSAETVNQERLFVISGPSGVGKTTIYKRLLAEHPEFQFSVSLTTRARRPQEREGIDYRFIDQEAFLACRDRDELAEWAEVHGNWYGTLRRELVEKTAPGCRCVLDVDVQGARSLKDLYPDANYIFIAPPSLEALSIRLQARSTEDDASLALRLANAEKELAASRMFDYIIINDHLERAYCELVALVTGSGLPAQGTSTEEPPE